MNFSLKEYRLDAAGAKPASQWNQFVQRNLDTTLYHREPWLRLLSETYGFRFYLATLGRDSIEAGCMLAKVKTPLSRRFVALPFSDRCPPLAVDSASRDALMRALSGSRGDAFELRGAPAPQPWQISDCFSSWSLDLARPMSAIDRAADRNFRRNYRRGMESGVSVTCGNGLAELKRFYRLQLATRHRLGLPPQPFKFFRHAQRIFGSAMEIWLVGHGSDDQAGLVLLRDGEVLHAKWAARLETSSTGVNHVLFWSAVEKHAGKARSLDLGRTDSRNEGLNRFKKEMGATATPLPYAFFPRMPAAVSSESLAGAAKLLSTITRYMPLFATRALGAVYGYLT